MPFPTVGPTSPVDDDLVEFYRSLPKSADAPKDLWFHQGEIVRSYAPAHLKSADVALELPPGAGKTLVGGTIAEWRRRRLGERAVYACATRGLAHQTHAKLSSYGVRSVLLIGSNHDWLDADRLRYTSAQAVAVTTYWSIFNSNPPLSDAQLLILDDAHAAENAVAGPWSITIDRRDDAYMPIVEALAPTLESLVVARLTDPAAGKYANDIYMASVVGVAAQAADLADLLRRAVSARAVNKSTKYVMRLVESHFDRMLVYVSRRAIVFRPFIPPTSTLAAFDGAQQRLYMSATLGEGGELERTFGRPKIARLPVPSGWDRRGNGRRFFAFPESTKDLAAAPEVRQAYIQKVIAKFGRAVVLAPDNSSMEAFLSDWVPAEAAVFRPDDVEDSLASFASAPLAVLGMANRYDGLDLPDDACRLVIIAGLPARGDLQERFLAKGLGAIEVLQERIRARITQGAGRATRNPTDFAAVLMLGTDLASFAGRLDVQEALHPELHAELKFGLMASLENSSAELLDLLDHFANQTPEWAGADATIRSMRDSYTQKVPPGTKELSDAASHEVAAWQFLWQGEWNRARESARSAADTVRGSRGSQRYAALWNYLLGSWTLIAGGSGIPRADADVAAAAFNAARAGARGTTWLSHLASPADLAAMEKQVLEVDALDGAAVAQAVVAFDRLRRPAIYAPLADQIRAGIAGTAAVPFEGALVRLGELAGASSFVGDGGGTAKPDASWDYSGVLWVTWEAKSEARADTEVNVSSVDQTNRHLRSMADRLGQSIPSGSVSILVTPQNSFDAAAPGIAEDHSFWVNIQYVQDLAARLDGAWRTIRTTLAPDSEQERKRQVILEVFHTAGVLPTQWMAQLNGIQRDVG
ncbi:DEAD/DEAH box helicase [Nocardioides plantarum]|uniref:DEAD/DEAH box helicase n=1 Tax=Nocardioides plantarum TaxID=29299 RepID=A0ABV5KC05_9ACTN|nr:DEAD/DEAH box helicase [Nocardioides plantarum]